MTYKEIGEIRNYDSGWRKTTVIIPLGEVKFDVTISAVAKVDSDPIIKYFTVDRGVYGGVKQYSFEQGMGWEYFVGSVYDVDEEFLIDEYNNVCLVNGSDIGKVFLGISLIFKDSDLGEYDYSVSWPSE